MCTIDKELIYDMIVKGPVFYMVVHEEKELSGAICRAVLTAVALLILLLHCAIYQVDTI